VNTVLIVLTLLEVLILVVVLATYLVTIAAALRRVSHTLGLVTFGVRAIEQQTASLGPVLTDVNAALEQVAGALDAVGAPAGAPADVTPAAPGPPAGQAATEPPAPGATAP